MRVRLAYPYKEHNAGDEIDLPNATARNLIFTGRARKAEPEAETADEPLPIFTEE